MGVRGGVLILTLGCACYTGEGEDSGSAFEGAGSGTGTASDPTPNDPPSDDDDVGDESTGDAGDGASEGDSTGSGGPDACVPPEVDPQGFFAAPDGSPGGAGTIDDPWDLATAIDEPPGVAPGDTIWLRGGVYEGSFVVKLDGLADAPITVRSHPGEWAVIDGGSSDQVTVQVYRQHTVLRDLEITNTNPERVEVGRPSGIYVEGDDLSFINVIVHDVGTGITSNSGTGEAPELAPRTLLYGSIFFNNGYDIENRGHGHHTYLQNRTDTKVIADNLMFNSFGFGVHAYSETDSHHTEGYEIVGNVWWGAGAGSSSVIGEAGQSKLYDNCLIGHNGTLPVARVELRDNLGFAKPGARNIRLGWGTDNEDATLTGNYLLGATIFQNAWQSITMSGNTFVGPLQGADPADFPDNAWLTVPPRQTEVFVRPNAHAEHRAHVAVFNWAGSDEVEVALDEVLEVGAPFEIHSAQDVLGAPVLEGVYEGGSIRLPMVDLPVAQPVGLPNAIVPEELPGRDFAAFVVQGDACG